MSALSRRLQAELNTFGNVGGRSGMGDGLLRQATPRRVRATQFGRAGFHIPLDDRREWWNAPTIRAMKECGESRSASRICGDLPLATGKYRMSGGRLLEALQSTLVEVTTAEGAVGYGEACTLAGSYIEGFQGSTWAAIRELAPVVFETDAMHPAVINARFDALIRGHAPAKSALDAALWDARGKFLGQPVAALLGGIHQPTYGVFHPLSLDDPEVMAQDAHEKLALGYRRWQLKIGDDPIEDAARVKAAYDVIGAVRRVRHL